MNAGLFNAHKCLLDRGIAVRHQGAKLTKHGSEYRSENDLVQYGEPGHDKTLL